MSTITITAKTHTDIERLLDEAGVVSPHDPSIQRDIRTVRSAIVSDGSVYSIGDSSEVNDALSRLIVGRDGFSDVSALIRNSRYFGVPYWNIAGFKWLYDHSPTLRAMPAEFLTPKALVEELVRLRPQVAAEISAIKHQTPNYALVTLVDALIAGGRITQNSQKYARFATARDLYDRSAILQGISDDDLATPERLTVKLISLKPEIIQEQRAARGVSEDVLDDYALATLVQALEAGGRIIQNLQTYVRMAGSRDFFDRSPLLQGISGDDLAMPDRLIARLVLLKPAIIQEQRAARGVDADALDGYALGTLVSALEAGGRITLNIQQYKRLASAREFYDRSPILQGISSDDLATPERLISKLASLKAAIVQEQQVVRGVDSSVLDDYALGTLVQALKAGGRLPQDLQTYARLASARDLYDRSPILQGISGDDLATSARLISKLVSLKAAIVQEQRAARGVSSDVLDDYALSTLVQALIAGGRISQNIQQYQRLSSARELYDRSPILQGISGADLSTPDLLTAKLISLRPAIIQEQRSARKVGEGTLDDYALGTLMQALAAGGRIAQDFQQYERSASARELFDRSPILQGISSDDLSVPEKLIDKLVSLRPAIIQEQRAIRGVDAAALGDYALTTLVQALEAGGRIAQNIQKYMRLGGTRDLFDRSSILQGISGDDLSTPARLISKLASLKAAIVQEQQVVRGVDSSVLDDYALGTLVQALEAGGRLTENVQTYERFASARELFDRSPILQGISGDDLSTPARLISKLASLKPAIIQEQRVARGVNSWALSDYALTTLVQALEAGGRITQNIQNYMRLASARELYDRSAILQGIASDALSTPYKLVAALVSLRPAIIQEQRAVRGVGSDVLDDYALGTLVTALIAGGKITQNTQRYERLAGSRELYDRSPTLWNIPLDVASDDEQLIRFLVTYRDRVAVENLRALGVLSPTQFLFEGAEAHYSVSTLLAALYAGGVITEHDKNQLGLNIISPLQYFLARRDVIEPEIRRIMNVRRYKPVIDMSLFTYTNDPRRQLSEFYVKNIVKWSRWFLRDPEVAVRSIYKADEMAAWTLFSFRYIVEAVPGNIAWRLEQVGWNAAADPAGSRRIAVGLLRDILDYYDGYKMQGVVFDEDIENGLYQIRRLYEWNKDALIASGSGAPTTSPAVTPTASPAPQAPLAPSAPSTPVSDGASSASAYEITRLPDPEWQDEEWDEAGDEDVPEEDATAADISIGLYTGTFEGMGAVVQ